MMLSGQVHTNYSYRLRHLFQQIRPRQRSNKRVGKSQGTVGTKRWREHLNQGHFPVLAGALKAAPQHHLKGKDPLVA